MYKLQWNLALWTPNLCGHPALEDTFVLEIISNIFLKEKYVLTALRMDYLFGTIFNSNVVISYCCKLCVRMGILLI